MNSPQMFQALRDAAQAFHDLGKFRQDQLVCPRKDIAMIVAYRAKAVTTLRTLYNLSEPEHVVRTFFRNRVNTYQACLLVEGAIESAEDDLSLARDLDWHADRMVGADKTLISEGWPS